MSERLSEIYPNPQKPPPKPLGIGNFLKGPGLGIYLLANVNSTHVVLTNMRGGMCLIEAQAAYDHHALTQREVDKLIHSHSDCGFSGWERLTLDEVLDDLAK